MAILPHWWHTITSWGPDYGWGVIVCLHMDELGHSNSHSHFNNVSLVKSVGPGVGAGVGGRKFIGTWKKKGVFLTRFMAGEKKSRTLTKYEIVRYITDQLWYLCHFCGQVLEELKEKLSNKCRHFVVISGGIIGQLHL